MRLSTRLDDPGYHPAAGGAARVTLDGAELPDCVTADEERGLAVCLRRDDRGRVMLNHRRTDVQFVERRGIVRIHLLRPERLGIPA